MFGTASCGRPFTEPRDRNLDSLYQVTYISFNVISESFVINQNNTFLVEFGYGNWFIALFGTLRKHIIC